MDCSDFGPYDFDNLSSGRQRVQVTDVVAADGRVLQTVFHIGLHETERNSETGFSLPLKGSVHEVWDYASNTRTLTGAVFMGMRPGKGTYISRTRAASP